MVAAVGEECQADMARKMDGRLASESLAGLVRITHVIDQRLCFGDRDVSASCLKVSTTSGAFRGLGHVPGGIRFSIADEDRVQRDVHVVVATAYLLLLQEAAFGEGVEVLGGSYS